MIDGKITVMMFRTIRRLGLNIESRDYHNVHMNFILEEIQNNFYKNTEQNLLGAKNDETTFKGIRAQIEEATKEAKGP